MTKPERADLDQWLNKPIEDMAPDPDATHHVRQEPTKEQPMEPMKKLVEGIQKYQSDVFTQKKELFDELAKGQSPGALFVACSDSRVDPCDVTQTQPGELFVLRTAGNIIPPYGAVIGGEAGTIEYAVSALKIPHIIVCGHSQCGAMGGLLQLEKLNAMPAVMGLLSHAEATRRIVNENHPDVTDQDQRVALAVETNVLVQLENLRTHPSVAAAIARGDLQLHGWVYQFETGQVRAFDPEQKQFAELSPGSIPSIV